jgi:regulator of sigma E protease
MNPIFLLAAVPIFALMVLVHEFGHFITARWAGIRVEEFAIGFPPRLFAIKRGETVYSINLLPIGGYVRMPGENGETTDEEGRPDPGSFASKTAGKRAIVLLAGVTMNLLLAFVLFTGAEAAGPVIASSYVKVMSGGPAATAGLVTGDHVVAIDGHPIKTYDDLIAQTNAVIAQAPNGAKTYPVTLLVQHPGVANPVTITVHANTGSPHLDVTTDISHAIHQTHPIWEAPARGLGDIPFVIGATGNAINQIVHHKIALSQAVSGPVGIVKVTGDVASSVSTSGWYPLLFLAGFLSLNLAFVNILPIPALDGGRVLFIIIEVLRRGKRMSPEREGLINLIGMGALLFLVLLVTINDVGNILGGH